MISVVLGASPAAAAPAVTCGGTVTADVTLTANLHCPSSDGLILDPDVTLDLGGHSLVGPGTSGVGVQTNPSSISQGGNNIRNGTIEGWGTGILLRDSEGVLHTVSDVVLLGSPVRHVVGATTLELTRVTAVDSSINGDLGGGLAISQSSLTRSAVNLFQASATIADSTLVQSPLRSSAQGTVTVTSSRLDGKGTSALAYLSETVITIDHSIVENFPEPISGFWGGVTLTNNRFADMPDGVLGDISSGIGSDGVSEIVGNVFIRSGVALRGDVPMVVENNIFTQNETAVVFTRDEPLPGDPPLTNEQSRATGNILWKNAGTGIQTDIPGLAVGGNIAIRNGGYGIHAPGAVDLGGNIAVGNSRGQCVGVACRPGDWRTAGMVSRVASIVQNDFRDHTVEDLQHALR